MSGFLREILDRKSREAVALALPQARRALEARLESAPAPRDFRAALTTGNGFRIIAEMKRASPSLGLLSTAYDPARIAAQYQSGGACALSVLTDAPSFAGHPQDLIAARQASALPIIRKDFLIDALQVDEARSLGADAVLLIGAVLSPGLLRQLLRRSRELGMAALVEVHGAEELEGALAAGADLIGVNNRDLRTFSVDLSVSFELASRFPPDVLRVSESGIRGRADLECLARAGYQAFLVGEALMTAADPLAVLKGWTR